MSEACDGGERVGGLGVEDWVWTVTNALKRTGPPSSCGVDGEGGSEDGLRTSDKSENGLRRVWGGGLLNGPGACCRQSIQEIEGPREQVNMSSKGYITEEA